jgi:hypothetical protein
VSRSARANACGEQYGPRIAAIVVYDFRHLTSYEKISAEKGESKVLTIID